MEAGSTLRAAAEELEVSPGAGSLDRLPAWTTRAALVYGPRKAGTTLLLNLLDGGDFILAFPAEIKFKRLHRVTWDGEARDRYLRRSRVAHLKRDNVSLERYRSLWAAVPAAAVAGNLPLLLRLDAWHMHRSAARPPSDPVMWCAKDVGGNTHAVVGLWRSAFADGKIVFLVRDPPMVTRAIVLNRRRRGIRLSWWSIARETAEAMRVVTAQARYRGDPNVHFVAYEDLVEDPAAVMRQVAAFLGVPYSETFAAPTVFGVPVVVATSSRATTEVFRGREGWAEGLSRRERLAVGLTTRLLRRLPRYRSDYAALRKAISGR